MALKLDRRHLMLAAASAAATLLAACDRQDGSSAGTSGGKATFTGVDITGAKYASRLDLPDAQGKQRTLAEFKGKLVVVFFGFTHCPDVCPTTMAELAQVKQSLGADGERIQGIFITVDPERDTPDLLKTYVTAFDPSFIALRGTPEQTQALAKEYRIFFAKAAGKTPDSYTIDHTAGSFIFDTQGRVRLFTRYGSGAQALASDLKALLAEGA